MLRIALIAPNEEVKQQLAALLPRIPDIEIVGAFSEYPTVEDMLRTLRVRRIDLLFLSVDNVERAESLAAAVDDLIPGLPLVSVGSNSDPALTLKLMHLGIREHVTVPIEATALAEAIDAARRRLKRHPVTAGRLSDLYTFFPAKPGVGTSTIAVSTSCALAEDLGARALLLDCDLSAGAIKFLLKLDNASSIVDALGHAQNLDEGLWAQMIAKWGKLDVLHAGGLDPLAAVDPASLGRVLAIARPMYEVICADLGSNLDAFSIELMKESRRIFLVTTPEVVPLHLAADRMRHLNDLGLGDRVCLLLNRKTKSSKVLTDQEVEQVVGIPVGYCFSNDYRHVQASIIEGRPVGEGSDLGQSILDLAHSLVPHLEPKQSAPHRKFLEFFHVPAVAEPEEVWHG